MLARIRKSMEEKDQGFTLIELLVVMIIIGILAAIAIPVFLNQRAKARVTSAKADASVIAKELSTYYVDGTATTAITQTATGANGAAGQFTITPASGGGSPITGKLSPNNVIPVTPLPLSTSTADGKFCVLVGTGTTGDGYVQATSTGLTVVASPSTCTPA